MATVQEYKPEQVSRLYRWILETETDMWKYDHVSGALTARGAHEVTVTLTLKDRADRPGDLVEVVLSKGKTLMQFTTPTLVWFVQDLRKKMVARRLEDWEAEIDAALDSLSGGN